MCYPTLQDLSLPELEPRLRLLPDELLLLKSVRLDQNRLGLALLFVASRTLGYIPRARQEIPAAAVEVVAGQLGLHPRLFAEYRWKGRVWKQHCVRVRATLPLRPLEFLEKQALRQWLIEKGYTPNRREMLRAAISRCRQLGFELPQEPEFLRVVRSARRVALESLFDQVSERIDAGTREKMQACLVATESEPSLFDQVKSPAGKPGKTALLEETKKLSALREFALDRKAIFCDVPERVFRLLRNRARAEDAHQMRRHPPARRLTLLAAFLCSRAQEVTDQVVTLFLDVIRKVQKGGEQALTQEIVADLGAVYNGKRLIHSLVRAADRQRTTPAWDLLLDVVGERKLQAILTELDAKEIPFEEAKARRVQQKFRGYRQMVAPLLKCLDLHASSPKQAALLEALTIVKRNASSKQTYLPARESIPKAFLTKPWRRLVEQETEHGTRYLRTSFELCVLSKLEKALKCKEIWVEGAYRFRDPSEDLPADWETRRREDYRRLALPADGAEFVSKLQEDLRQALRQANEAIGQGRPERIATVRRSPDGKRARIYSPRPSAREERSLLAEIKGRVQQHFGMLDLLDILLEADRQVDFLRFFQTSGQRRVLGEDEVRRRLLLVLFSLGTNLGLRRIHAAAGPSCSYDDLRYFFSRFVSIEALRAANVALINRILAIRNSELWGPGTSCASDGKHLAAWDRNAVSEWHPHYTGRGVMIYWHVSTNAVCIHSQVKAIRSTDVAPMIHGLVHHGTTMDLESNYVDSHGQSVVAFAFCRLLGFELLPRLKRIRDEKLYLPESSFAGELRHLEGVLGQPIRWDRIAEQYDDMVRHAIAIQDDIAPAESILRRFNSNNRSHPTYKALVELGRVEKTLFLCRLLSDNRLGAMIHEALQGIESWNSCVEFICFGRKAELQSNDPAMHELSVGAIHLLQNALVLANTLMVERVLSDRCLLEQMEPDDRRALTPLFTAHVNPYGEFELDLAKPSFLLEAA